MNKTKRIFFAVALSAVSFTVLSWGAIFSIPYFVDLNKYKDSFASQIEEQTGFKLSCEDISFKKTFSPYFKINLHHTIVLYPDNSIFLKLKDAELKIKVLPLISKKIIVKDAKLTRPIISLTLYKDFSTSLDKYFKPDKKINTNGFNLESVIYDTVLERYKIKISDESLSKNFYLEGDELLVKDVKLNEKIHIIIKGALFEGEKEYLKYDLDVNSLLSQNKRHFTFSPFKPLVEYDLKGNVSGKLNILKENLLNGNLNLEDISLKIDNAVLKDNNIKFIFKGEEVQTEALVHTSKTDEAQLTGKYCFGKKKYIDIKTKAKNVRLENLCKIIKVVSASLNVKNPMPDIDIKGLLNADFILNSDFKKLKSEGTAKIINAQISHKSLPYSVNKINADINFQNNKIDIKKAQAFVNSTPINIEGAINEDVGVDIQAGADNLDVKTLVSLFLTPEKIPFNITKGKLSFISYIKGNYGKNLNITSDFNIKDIGFIEKMQKIPVNVKDINAKLISDTKKYSGDVLCSGLKTVFNKKNITSDSIKILFDNKNIQIKESKLNLINSPVSFLGTVTDYIDSPKGKFKIEGDIISSDLAELFKEYINQPHKAVGKLKTKCSIDVLKDNLKIKTQINADKDNYLSYAVVRELLNKPSITSFDADIKGKNIIINELSLTENSKNVKVPQLKVSGQISGEKEPVFKNLNLIIPTSFTVSTNFFGGEEISLNGSLILNNTLKNPILDGSLKVFNYNIKKLYTSIKNADIIFSHNNIKLIAPDVMINNSKFNITADIEPKLSNIITVENVQLNSLNLDLNTIFTMIQKESNPFASTLIEVKKGTAAINNFKVLDLKARDVVSDFSIKNNILKLSNISAVAYNGRVNGNINYDFNHSEAEINLNGKNIDIKESLYDLCRIEDNMMGKTDFTTAVSINTGTYETALKSLKGNVSFEAKDGKMGTLGKFEYYLYAQNLLYHGILNATLNRVANAITADNTSKFKTAEGKISFKDGYLTADEIKTTGHNMSLFLKGRTNMLNNQANIEIYGRISDEVKSKLGAFGDVSIAELVNGQAAKKNVNVMAVPISIMSKIPDLYSKPNEKTNTFKVNIYGKVDSPSSINSFMWTVPKETKEEKLPDFLDI